MGTGQEQLEIELISVIKVMMVKHQQVTRLIIFMNVINISPLFKGGKDSLNFMDQVCSWFYYGFKKRYNISYKRISGSSTKMPPGWEEKGEQIVRHVGNLQVPKIENDIWVSDVDYGSFVDTDHVPVYCVMPVNFSWYTKNDGNVYITTGGAEKDRFTVQLSCLKSGRKRIPIIIFKVAPLTDRSRRKSVSVELRDRLPYNIGNHHPP